MDQNLKERLVGASVLTILAVIFIPMFLSDVPITADHITETNIPEKPKDFSSRIVPLAPVVESGLEDASSATGSDVDSPAGQGAMSEVEPEPAEEPQPDTAPVVRQVVKDSNGVGLTAWVVQVGSFSSEENAQKLNQELRDKKYPSFVEPLVREGSKVIYRVRVGPELRRSNAEKLKKEIEKSVGVEGILVKYP